MVKVCTARNSPAKGLMIANNKLSTVPKIAEVIRALCNKSLGRVWSGEAVVGLSGTVHSTGAGRILIPKMIFARGGCSGR